MPLLLDLIYPQRVLCLLCHQVTPRDVLCPACRRSLEEKKLPTPCRVTTQRVWSAYEHAGEAQKLVLMLKKSIIATAAIPLAAGMADLIPSMHLPEGTVLTSVPMPLSRKMRRGIDHAATLAQAVATASGLPMQPLLRRAPFQLHTQQGLNRARRLTNAQGAFLPIPGEIMPHSVLLIDDVTTTGATLSACSQALRQAGVTQLVCLTATYRPPPGAPPELILR